MTTTSGATWRGWEIAPALIALAVVACHRPTSPTGPSPIESFPSVAAPSATPSADASAPVAACRDGLTLPLPAAATALAVGGTTVYWVDENADRSNTVRVWGMSVRDGLPQLLATERGAFGGLVADGTAGV
jgi:hypothetical protein